ncbi:hypothetical protein ASPNIDRAFT_137436, partial [Aspergillus niger ATCC 1015]
TIFPGQQFLVLIELLFKEWVPIRLHLLKAMSQLLDAHIPLTGTTLVHSATVRLHYYDSQKPFLRQGSLRFPSYG